MLRIRPGAGLAGRAPFSVDAPAFLRHNSARTAAISKPEAASTPDDELDSLASLPTPKLTYRHSMSGSAPSALQGLAKQGLAGAGALRTAPGSVERLLEAEQQQQNNAGAHQQRSLQQFPPSASAQQSQAYLYQLAEQNLGKGAPVWDAAASNQPALQSLPVSWSDDLLQADTGAVYKMYMHFLARGDFTRALDLLQRCKAANRDDVFRRLTHSRFFDHCKAFRSGKAVVDYLNLLPCQMHKVPLYNMALDTLAVSRDLESATVVLNLAKQQGVVDQKLITQMIKVCKSVGNVDRAYKLFIELKALPGARLDGYVYGALIATCAEAMKRDLETAHERKEQYVLLERAFQYVADAEAASIHLDTPVWNSLLMCAGRCGELNRAFEVLEMMQARGVRPTAVTYGSLIEACVEGRHPDKARRVFEVALSKGYSSLKLYTQAISACKTPDAVDLDHAITLYNQLALKGIKPDKKLFACMMAVAGKAGQLEYAFQLLTDMHAEGLAPSSTTCSGLIHACLNQGNLALARKVYDLCRQQGVLPVISQFNRLMDWYAVEFRFGEVATLLHDMTTAGIHPNLNTYRVIINACQRAGQSGLAFQVFALMHANKTQILQEKFAQTIYYMLIKACFNQIMQLWSMTAHPLFPKGSIQSRLPQVRQHETDKVLEALGGGRLKSLHRSNPFDGPPDTIDWASHAVSAFHHMIARGHRPSLTLLDKLFNCLRLRLDQSSRNHEEDDSELMGSAQARTAGTASTSAPQASLPDSLPPVQQHYENRFDKRALQVLEDAVSRGILPRFDPESQLQIDMRFLPPTVAEVYCLSALLTLERRALKLGHTHYYHSFTMIVPPFDPDLVNWPSYIMKHNHHYTLNMSEEDRAKLSMRISRKPQHKSSSRLQQQQQQAAASAAAQAQGSMSDDERGSASGSFDDVGLDSWDEEVMSSSSSSIYEYVADSTTGLAVAATFRRLKVYAHLDPKGMVVVESKEITRWLRRIRKDNRIGAPSPSLSPPGKWTPPVFATGPGQGMGSNPTNVMGMSGRALTEQQRFIRSSSYDTQESTGGPGRSLFGGAPAVAATAAAAAAAASGAAGFAGRFQAGTGMGSSAGGVGISGRLSPFGQPTSYQQQQQQQQQRPSSSHGDVAAGGAAARPPVAGSSGPQERHHVAAEGSTAAGSRHPGSPDHTHGNGHKHRGHGSGAQSSHAHSNGLKRPGARRPVVVGENGAHIGPQHASQPVSRMEVSMGPDMGTLTISQPHHTASKPAAGDSITTTAGSTSSSSSSS